ncbi:unnamed protein product [Rhizoctonia solani]|uniref:Uncharacterized protein n=1 Tax=Rhizoctonia solani TaxID=456999 RepID=A0A8H3H2A2_9AGAM|nr:unnamed protein product [Rhizoctonia solani]
MSTEQPAAFRQRKGFSRPHGLRNFHGDVDLDSDDDGLTEQRLEQWRPFWQNPFAYPKLGLTSGNDRPQIPAVDVGGDDEKALEKPEMNRASTDLSQLSSVSKSVIVVHAGPAWVHLFYDLAWTATFSSLTQNGKFDDQWNNLSYVTFFAVMWWLWASQTLYSVHFYTNDWIHLISTFAQLIIFGFLAATTRGYDVTMYITKYPWTDGSNPQTIDQMTDPEQYLKDRLASYSFKVIAFSLAASRTVHWIQHILVWRQACYTARTSKIHMPLKPCVLPLGLSISVAFFWAAAGVTSKNGKSHRGAIIKFVLWGVGLLVEILLHGYMESLDWKRTLRRSKESTIPHDASPKPELLRTSLQSSESPAPRNRAWPVPSSNVNLRERLEGITTVILGEGLNGIAGTFYAILSAPGLGGPVAINLICAAFIIYLLAYFYFEGPTGHRGLKEKGRKLRQMTWLLLHLPFMLSIILLLLGVKNQFLLTSYLSTTDNTFIKLDEVMSGQQLYLGDPDSATNLPMKNFLLKRGLKWADEIRALNATVTSNGSVSLVDISEEKLEKDVGAWFQQMSLKIMVQLYKTFMGGNQTIESDMQDQIQKYYTNFTLPYEDYANDHDQADSVHWVTILSKLLGGNVTGARYITGLAGIILISLGLMNRVHSKPRDRFQWGIILTRIFMGSALLLLEILNVGHYQTLWIIEGQWNRLAGVIRWIWAWWVLPTLAIAFAIEFVIEYILLRCAALAIERKRGRVSGPLWRIFLKRQLDWFAWLD